MARAGIGRLMTDRRKQRRRELTASRKGCKSPDMRDICGILAIFGLDHLAKISIRDGMTSVGNTAWYHPCIAK